jgi:DNA-binding GntR family transcriptional regulator
MRYTKGHVMPADPVSFSTATLASQVYEHLLRQISTGAYRPGHPLVERDLVVELGVSRTPIREALLRLTDYGLVEGEGRSARVRQLTPAEVIDLYRVRRSLETEAVRQACGRLTPDDFARLDAAAPAGVADSDEFEAACYRFDMELHRTVAERSGNPLLARMLRQLHDCVQLVHKPVADRRGRLVRELEQHRAIVAALRAGDAAAARRAMLAHLRTSCQTQVRCLSAADPAARAGVPAPS